MLWLWPWMLLEGARLPLSGAVSQKGWLDSWTNSLITIHVHVYSES